MRIIVDADACPRAVLLICLELGEKYDLPVWTVASFNHDIVSDHHVTVGDEPEEADLKIINLAETGDLTVTQDWGLAAMLIGKGARCISPSGKEYQPDKINILLEERALKAKYRRSGGRTRGPKKRNAEDDRRFLNGLERMINHPG